MKQQASQSNKKQRIDSMYCSAEDMNDESSGGYRIRTSTHVQVALHPHLAQQLQLPQDMMADDDEEEEEEEEEEDFETQEKTKALCKRRSAVEEWREKWDGDYKCCNAMVLQ
jgi:hypothetical protein